MNGRDYELKVSWHPEVNVIAEVQSINNVRVRLTEERWFHIVEYHGELGSFQPEIMMSVAEPDNVYFSPVGVKPNFAAVKAFVRLVELGLAENLVVHYRESSQSNGFILTAFVMSGKRLNKRFGLWQKLR